MRKFENKVVLITGGSRGLGATTALKFAEQGATVAISYINSEAKALEIVEKAKAFGVKAEAFKADQGSTKEVEALVKAVAAKFGKIDILVNNAAVSIPGTLNEKSLYPEFDRQRSINVDGVITAIRTAADFMKEGGRIITVGSAIANRVAFQGSADYAATKAAIVGYTKGVAREFGPRGITVNVLQPGLIDTDMAAPFSDLFAMITQGLSIQRVGRPEEIASGILFLASPEASYITGTVLDIDGGYSA